MIGRLTGTIVRKAVESVLIDVQGVGYEVVCPLSVLDVLPRVGEAAKVSIHTHVREDQITLFGFADEDQRSLFRTLVGVTGVGPKLALACLGTMTPDNFADAIATEDLKRLTGVPGVGKRTAQRLVLELREKLRRFAPSAGPAPSASTLALDELDSALRNLGYKAKAVDTLIEGLREDAADQDFEALLREALRRLSR
jgi:holliday junction DNA helicase RuvA